MVKIPAPLYTTASETSPPSEKQRGSLRTAATNIYGAFPFYKTAEGADFWSAVCARLEQIATDGQLK
jgi:hypothetical protein